MLRPASAPLTHFAIHRGGGFLATRGAGPRHRVTICAGLANILSRWARYVQDPAMDVWGLVAGQGNAMTFTSKAVTGRQGAGLGM